MLTVIVYYQQCVCLVFCVSVYAVSECCAKQEQQQQNTNTISTTAKTEQSPQGVSPRAYKLGHANRNVIWGMQIGTTKLGHANRNGYVGRWYPSLL